MAFCTHFSQCILQKDKLKAWKEPVQWYFRLQVFYMDQISPGPWLYHTVSNFIENSRRYSQLKVLAPVANGKIFNKKSFHLFFWTPLGSRFSTKIKFVLQVHFKLTVVWYCSQCLPPVSLIPVVNLHLWISLRIFEKIEITLMLFSGAWGEDDSWKKSEAKNRLTLSL